MRPGLRMLGVLGIAACVGSSAGADPSLPQKVAVLPIKLLDTSAEPLDQRADHARRLAMLASDLAIDLGKTGLFRTVEVEAEGWEVEGWPTTVILRGKVMVENGRLLGSPTDGQLIPRKIDPGILRRPAF